MPTTMPKTPAPVNPNMVDTVRDLDDEEAIRRVQDRDGGNESP
jgi:hypothetical protein